MTKGYPKRGKRSKLANRHRVEDRDVSPSGLYGAVDFGGARPGVERRFSGNYGKNQKARGPEAMGLLHMPRFL